MNFLLTRQLLICFLLVVGLSACNVFEGDTGAQGAAGQDGANGQDLTNPDLATNIDFGPFGCTDSELTATPDKNCRLYIKGSMNSWSSRPEAELTHQGNGVYIALFRMSPGSYSFKISDPAWSAERDLAIGTGASADVVLNTPMTLQRKYTAQDGTSYSNQNMTIAVTGDEDQIFRFTLDASGTINQPTLMIENVTAADSSNLTQPLYLVGSFNNWSAHEDFLFEYEGAGSYEVMATFDAPQYISFKVQQGTDRCGTAFKPAVRDGDAVAETGRTEFFTGDQFFEDVLHLQLWHLFGDDGGDLFEGALLTAARHVHEGTAGGQDGFKSDHG